MAIELKQVKRTVNFFDLVVGKDHKKSEKVMLDLFRHIQELSKTRKKARFIQRGDKVLYVRNVEFLGKEKQLRGRILLVRKDALPELLNRETDVMRGVEADQKEDIVEASHFIVSYKGLPQIAFEHNHQGARFTDLQFYLESMAVSSQLEENVTLLPIAKDDIKSYKERINRVSYIIGRIHKDQIARLNDPTIGLFSAMDSAADASRAEYIEVKFKYDFTSVADAGFLSQMVDKIIDFVRKSRYNPFDVLKVKAEDKENENRMKEFDLLNAWVRVEVKVEQNERYRTISMTDMYEKMAKAFTKELGR